MKILLLYSSVFMSISKRQK